jgi:replicative DNA helicase
MSTAFKLIGRVPAAKATAKPAATSASPALTEVESHLLALVVRNAGLVDALPTLHAIDLQGPNADIYAAITKLSDAQGVPLSFLTLAASLEADGKGPASIQALALESVQADATMAAAYAELILQASRRRQISTASACLASDPDSQEFASDLDRARELSIGAKAVMTSADAVADFRARLQRKIDGEDPPISTGLADLDKRLAGGLRGGQVIVLAARPGQGKSALAQGIAENVASDENGKTAIFISLEMLAHEIMERRVASASRGLVPLEALRSGELDEEQLAEVDRLMPLLACTRMEFLASYSEDLDGIVQTVKDRAKRGDVGLVVLDYLQLIESGGGNATENREQQVSKVCRRIKKLALALQVPVLLLSQLNRDSEKGAVRRRPKMSDLRESGSIEQDADVILFIHNDMDDAPDSDVSQRTIIIEKQRAGASGVDVAVAWVGRECRFANLAHSAATRPASAPPVGRAEHLTGPAANIARVRQMAAANCGLTDDVPPDVLEQVHAMRAASASAAAGSAFNDF